MTETIAREATYLFFPILLLPIIFFILKHFKSYFLSKTSLPLPPGPSPWPILGNIPQMGKKPHITLTNFARSYGPLMSLRLGTQIMIIGSSTTAAEEILKTHDRSLSARYVPSAVPAKSSKFNHLSLGWALECNDGWKNLRTICRSELFSGKAMECQACLRETKATDMVKFVCAKEGKEVKVAELVFATVFNMLSNASISRDLISLEKEGVDGGMKSLIRKYIELISASNLSDFYPILGALDLQGLKKKAKEAFMRICATWEPIIKDRREGRRGNASSQEDFLDALLDNSCSNDQINYLLLSRKSVSMPDWLLGCPNGS
ncbi:(S)-N-methylcoclaurine 3'-hydroxylase-like protein [Cornus florida]|uniref:(S)-N-methylcoclaurine 3'-hydroxylase-like protein n=1 Tax=Cornus florida TaxID=4283 RepID=UPI0028967788|nr:(S)-N-methylcoclaurine 3'-hydroxylase-like protein [Cornus florida]